MKKQEKSVEVFDGEQYRSEDFPGYDWSLPEVIAWFQSKLALIPAEYRAGSRCEISSIAGYEGSSTATIEISYKRKETDEECQAREAQEQARRADKEAQERAAYEQLKRKFG